MTIDKEHLRAKIDSEEKFWAIPGMKSYVANYYPRIYDADAYNRPGHRMSEEDRKTPWWLYRERMRIALGVYEMSSTLERLNNQGSFQHTLHISTDDRTMVAYTPSVEAALADKQIKTPLGKYLRKFYLLSSDAFIQKIESAHRAEANAVLLFATDRAEMRRVYTTMEGDSGCMRYQPDKFGIANDMHPCYAYDAPGMAVAYTQTDEGAVRSRSLVWINPENPADKRYVRTYGDHQVLQRLLEREGYVLGPLNGAKLRKIPYISERDGPRENSYVLPYLDGPGGAQSDQRGKYVIDEGGDFLTIVGLDMYEDIVSSVGHDYCSISINHETARVTVLPLPANEFVSELTGATYTGFKFKRVKYWDGAAVKTAEAKELSGPGYNTNWCVCHPNGDTEYVFCKLDVPHFYAGGDYWIESDAARDYCGYKVLSTKYYPGEKKWSRSAIEVGPEDSRHVIEAAQAVNVLPETGDMFMAHEQELAAYRKQGYRNTVPLNGRKTIAVLTRKTLQRDKNGKLFDTVLHDDIYVQTMSGEWAKTNDCTYASIAGVRLWFPMDDVYPPWSELLLAAWSKSPRKDKLDRMMAEEIEVGPLRDVQLSIFEDAVARAHLYVVGGIAYPSVTLNGEKTMGRGTYDHQSYSSLVELRQWMNANAEKFAVDSNHWRYMFALNLVLDYVQPHIDKLKAVTMVAEPQPEGEPA